MFGSPKATTQHKGMEDSLKVSPELLTQLKEISTLLEQHNDNKLRPIFDGAAFKSIAQKLNIPSDQQAQLRDRINALYTEMNRNSYDGTSAIKSSDLKDKYLSLFTPTEFKQKLADIRNAGNGVVTGKANEQLENLVYGISNLTVSKRFYEYKYIMLNIVMLSVLDKLFSALFQFIKDIKDYNAVRTTLQTKSANELVDVLLEILNKASPHNINPKDIEGYDNLNAKLQALLSTVDEWSEVLKKRDDTMQEQIFNILSDFRKVDQTLVDEDMSMLGANRTGDRNSSPRMGSPVQSRGYYSMRNSRPNMGSVVEEENSRGSSLGSVRSPRRSFSLEGGFVRDGSRFPDEFYKEVAK